MYESSCESLSTCRSIAKNTWKDTNAIAKINLKSLEKTTEKRREMATKVLDGFSSVIADKVSVSYIHLRAHETGRKIVCRIPSEKYTIPHT